MHLTLGGEIKVRIYFFPGGMLTDVFSIFLCGAKPYFYYIRGKQLRERLKTKIFLLLIFTWYFQYQ